MKKIKDYFFNKKMSKLGGLCIEYFKKGDFQRSCELGTDLLKLQETIYGESSVEILSTLNRLSEILIAAGDVGTAKRYLERELAIALTNSEWTFVDASIFRLYMIALDDGDVAGANILAEKGARYAKESGDINLIERSTKFSVTFPV